MEIDQQETNKQETKEKLEEIYSFQTTDPSVISSCITTKEGILKFLQEMPQATRLKRIDKPSIQSILSQDIQAASKTLKESRKQLEDLLQTYPIDEMKFQATMGLLKKLTLTEAIVAFAQDDDTKIIESNPGLVDSLQEVKGLIATYLKQKTELQHLIRIKNSLTIADKALFSDEKDLSLQNFLSNVQTKRAYDTTTPSFSTLLAFEALSDLRLRKDQVEALTNMSSDDSNNTELEARTGFGKSQVLIPLWLFLKSRNENNLTVMAVPSSLLLDQERHLKKLLGSTFATGIRVISFPREKASDLVALQLLHKDLLLAMTKKQIVLIDIGSLHGLTTLGLKEALLKESTSPSTNGKALVEELWNISKLLQNQSSIFIDESRESLNPRQHYDYAVGSPVPVEKNRCETLCSFWQSCFFHEDIQTKWNFEFLPQNTQEGKKSLTQDNFYELQQDLAAIAQKNMFPFQTSCINHLMGAEASPEIREAINQLPYEYQSLYDLYRSQISTHLKTSLLKTCGERYDVNKKLVAFPHERGIPKPHSEFASLDDLLNFTLQANLKKEISEVVISSYIDSLRETYLKNSDLSSNLAFILFQTIQTTLGLPPIEEIEKSDIEKIRQLLNNPKNITSKVAFITSWIFPQVTLFPKKISGTSFHLLSHLNKVHAASGTADPDILHPKMQSAADPSAPIGNLLSICANSRIITIPQDPKEALTALLQTSEPNSPPIIIDVGGSFLDLEEKTILDLFFSKNPYIEAVTYYDQNGKCLLKMRGSSSSIPREQASLDLSKIGIFIRQGNSIGSDTPMPIRANGLVTLKHQTTESFFFQGAGRMRGLQNGQTLNIAISNEEAKLIAPAPNLTLPNLLRHLKIQEGKQKGLDYFFSLRLFLEDLIEEPLWEAENVDDLLRFSLMKDLIVSSSLKDPLKMLYHTRKDLTAAAAVKQLKDSALLLVQEKNLPLINITHIEETFDNHIQLEKLPLLITGGDNETEESITEAEKEQELLQENTQDNRAEGMTISFQEAPLHKWNGDYKRYFIESRPVMIFSGIALYFSPNFANLSKNQNTPAHKSSYLYILQSSPDGIWKVMALDLSDANAVFSVMERQVKEPGDLNQNFLLLQEKLLITDAPNSSISTHPSFPKLSLLAKILSGNANLNLNEILFLKNTDQESRDDIKTLTNYFINSWPALSQITSILQHLPTIKDENIEDWFVNEFNFEDLQQ